MNIRPATLTDIPALSKLEQQCQLTPWSVIQLTAALNKPSQIWIGEQQQQLVSMLVWQPLLDEAEIHLLNTDPLHRRYGYAQQLLQYIFQLAQQQGIQRLLLEVRASNSAAQALYSRNGFQICGRRKNYYSNQEDALILEKLC